jgi:ABC-type nickel/cobalt efflux system permease component RcnA/Tol biopolymer transport system component
MYAQSQSITLNGNGLEIDWKIAPGPFLADAVWQASDHDQNGIISSAEAQAWVAPYIAGLTISLDGKPVDSYQVQSIHWPATVDVLRAGEDSIEISMLVNWSANLTGGHELNIHNTHLEANSLNWFAFTSKQGLTFDQPSQNNGLLNTIVHFPDAPGFTAGDRTSTLTSWNSGTPNLPGFTDTVSKAAVNLANPVNPTSSSQPQAQTGGANMVTSALTGLVKTGTFSPLFLVSAFLLSLALGSLHAMTPGHGKALVGAYLVGSQGRTRDAVFLGLIVTITHTGSVLILGLITLLASHYILPALIVPWLEVISGLLVIGFGINLLIQRRRDLSSWIKSGPIKNRFKPVSIQAASEPLMHQHGTGVLHTHDASSHEHEHGDHSHGGHSHSEHSHALPTGPVSWKSLLTLGISGGLIPCPDAIAILLVAVALNRIPFGMLLIVAFSIGLALVLIAIGIAMVQGVRLITRSDLLSRFSVYTPVISAVIVSGLGVALTVNAVNSFKFSSVVLQSPSAQTSSINLALQTPTSVPNVDLQSGRVLYIESDTTGWDQLFTQSLAGGNPIQYTQAPSGVTGYSISPDQKTILYTLFKNEGGTSIWQINTDGTQNHLVLDCPQAECNSPEWYPDARKIAYERLDDLQNSTIPRFSIWWLDMGTGKTQPVFQDQTFPSSAPKFSPDGQWMSYISAANNTLVIYNLKDGHNISVGLGNQSIIPESWSPDGNSLLFGNPASPQEGSPLHIKRYILDSGQTIDLGGASDQTDFSAAWSPDGQWIAIDRNVPTSGGSQSSNQIWLVKPDGTQAHVLLDEDNATYSNLNWSADGRTLLYSRYILQFSTQNTGLFDVCATDIETGKSMTLVPGGDIPAFLP